MVIEVLYFDGCPNHASALAQVERLVDELGVEAKIEPVRVESIEDAERKRFLGSPTIRVDGRDVEPGADERTDYALACRVYRTGAGETGEPDEFWIRSALSNPLGKLV